MRSRGDSERRAGIPSPAAQLKLSATAWRQRGYAVGRYGRVRLTEAELRALGGEAAVRAYNDGVLTGERERRRAS